MNGEARERYHLRRAIVLVWLLCLLTALAGALGRVWLSGQIADGARQNKELETSLADLERNAANVETRLARLQSPGVMLSRLGDVLEPPQSGQVVWVERLERSETMVARQMRGGQ